MCAICDLNMDYVACDILTFPSIWQRTKLFFGPLVIQVVWYILFQYFTLVHVGESAG